MAQAVRFADGMAEIESIGIDMFLEVGPDSTLVKMGKRCVKAGGPPYDWLSSLQGVDSDISQSQSVADADVVLQGGLPPLHYKRTPFPWREASARMLRRRATEGNEAHFDVPIRGDLFTIASNHVVYGEIVVPGVVFVEMAQEAARAHMGDNISLSGIEMVWPLVVPKDGDTDAKQMMMRIAIIGNSRFELRSQGVGDDKWTTHCEGKVNKTKKDLPKPPPWDEVRARCPMDVDSAKLYQTVDSTGLWLGPWFQVCKEMKRNPDEISCKMQLRSDVPTDGYIVQPSLFDGTIHAVCATMFDQDPPFLKIFAGVGGVTTYIKNVPKDGVVYLYLQIHERDDQQQKFTCTVATEAGELMWVMEDVLFRKVSPEQIQKALAATKAKDAIGFFENEWIEQSADADNALDAGEKWLITAEDDKFLKELKKELGDAHTYASAKNMPDVGDFAKVVAVAAPNADHMDVLDGALKVLQKTIAFTKENAEGTPPHVLFVPTGTQVAQGEELRGAKEAPRHAGLWGLARCNRLEHSEINVTVVDIG